MKGAEYLGKLPFTFRSANNRSNKAILGKRYLESTKISHLFSPSVMSKKGFSLVTVEPLITTAIRHGCNIEEFSYFCVTNIFWASVPPHLKVSACCQSMEPIVFKVAVRYRREI